MVMVARMSIIINKKETAEAGVACMIHKNYRMK